MLNLTRDQTRKQRYNSKKARILPVSIATVHFMNDMNIGCVIRAAACFGATRVHVIGSMDKIEARKNSGSTLDYTNILFYSTIEEFLYNVRDTNIVCAELCSTAININKYKFQFNKPTTIVVGNETIGVPGILTTKYPTVYIPMIGPGYCLNTGHTANILLYEYSKQYCKVIK